MGSILDIVTGWTLFAGLIAALGGCAARWILIPRASRDASATPLVLEEAAGRLALAGALFLLPAMALFFVRQLLDFRDPFVPWTEDAALLLTGTAWGTTWIRGAAGAVLAVAAFTAVRVRGGLPAWIVATTAALGLAAFPAFTGHASGSDGPRALTLAADVLHVWAAGGWAGGLAFVLYAERRWRGGAGARAPASLLPTLVPVFSPMAIGCVALLVVSGVVGAWVHLSGVAALWQTPYGRALLVKLLFVGVALALGFVNWRRLTPRLSGPEGPDRLRRAATTELVVVQAVLILTALLVRTSPPMG